MKIRLKRYSVLIGVSLSLCCPLIQTPAKALNQQKLQHGSGRRPASSSDLVTLIRLLRARGSIVRLSSERVSEPFFAVPGRIIYLHDEPVWVFSYATSTGASKAAALVSVDGRTIGTSKPSWLGTPHFFRRPRSIVLYLGDEPRVIEALTRVLGQQFAGG